MRGSLIAIILILMLGAVALIYYGMSSSGPRELSADDIRREEARLSKLDMPATWPDESLSKVLGTYRGRTVVSTFICFGDVCPDNGGYFVMYEGVPESECQQIGGHPIVGYGWGPVYGGCRVLPPVSEEPAPIP